MQICEKLPAFCAAEAFYAVAPDAKKRSKSRVWTQTRFSTAKEESEPIPAAVSCAGAASMPGEGCTTVGVRPSFSVTP